MYKAGKQFVSVFLTIMLVISTIQLGVIFSIDSFSFSARAESSSVSSVASESNTMKELGLSVEAYRVIQLVNKERSKAGLNPLGIMLSLQNTANTRAKELSASYSHTRPDGKDFSTAYDLSLDYTALGENIAKGQDTAEEVMNSWMNSDGHRANILNEKFTHIGVGYNAECKGWTQNFMGSNCNVTSFTVVDVPEDASVGTDVEKLGIMLKGICSVHGACFYPVVEEYISGYDPTKTGQQNVKCLAMGGSTEFVIALQASSTSYTFQCGPYAYYTIYENGTLIISGKGRLWKTLNKDHFNHFYEFWREADFQQEAGRTGIYSWANYPEYVINVIISEGITGIAENSFVNCNRIESISIPSSVDSIGSYAFSGCTSLREIKLSSTMVSIGAYAFSGCTALCEIQLPDTLKSIGRYAFSGCTSLHEMILPDGFETIGSCAFLDSGLEKINLSRSVDFDSDSFENTDYVKKHL